jgi:EAL domain
LLARHASQNSSYPGNFEQRARLERGEIDHDAFDEAFAQEWRALGHDVRGRDWQIDPARRCAITAHLCRRLDLLTPFWEEALSSKRYGRDAKILDPLVPRALKRVELEKTNAVLHHRFEWHYQPVFQVSGRRLIGFEALVRLPAEDGKLISPSVFIPTAEDLRLIDKIGKW